MQLSKAEFKFLIITLAFAVAYFFSYNQLLGDSPDWENYDSFFDYLRRNSVEYSPYARFEYGFVKLSEILTILSNSNIFIFSLISGVCLSFKAWSIDIVSDLRFPILLALLFYIFRFLPLHEYTQIRAALATSLLFISTAFIISGKKYLAFSIAALSAFFHQTAVIYLPFMIFLANSGYANLLSAKSLLIFIGVVYIITSTVKGYGVNFLQDIVSIFQVYNESSFGDNEVNMIPISIVVDMLMLAFLLINWKFLNCKLKVFVLIESFGIAAFYGLIEYQILAFRVREFFSTFWVFIIVLGSNYQLRFRRPLILFAIINIFLYSYLYVNNKVLV